MKLNSILCVLSFVATTGAIPYRREQSSVNSTYIVMFSDEANVGGRVAFGSFDELISKHKQLIEDNQPVYASDRRPGSGEHLAFTPLTGLRGYVATLPTKQLVDLVKQQPETVIIEQDQIVKLNIPQARNVSALLNTKTTQSRLYSWGVDRLDGKVDCSYTYPTTEGQDTLVYVLDTGVRRTHNDFSKTGSLQDSRVIQGVSFVPGEDGNSDQNGHGTHVAGTCIGEYSGVAKMARLKSVKVLGGNGSGSLSGILRGLDFVMQDQATVRNTVAKKGSVVNMSLGSSRSTTINSAVRRLATSGIAVVVAAGNENQNACNTSPASEPSVITVGATTQRDRLASFSNWGSCVDINAPGEAIVSSSNYGNQYLAELSGTSMAAPHVAGVVSVILGDGVLPKDVPAELQKRAESGTIQRLRSDTINRLARV